MKIDVQDNGHIAVVRPAGPMDSGHVEALKQEVQTQIRQNRTALILSMKEVSFLSSRGLETLLWIRDTCRRYNIQFRLAGTPDMCRSILELTRLSKEFLTCQNADEAIQSLA